MDNISINKKQLEEYLSDFTEEKRNEIILKFENINFNCGTTLFKIKMKEIISMPKFGKRTINYWIGRGWSKEESLKKRKSIIRKKEDSPMNINFWLKRGYSKEESEFNIKSQRKFNIEYWIKRGYSKEESIIKVSEFQKENGKKLKLKLETDEKFRYELSFKRDNNINYWLKLGYNLDESKEKVSERQTTFSLEKCIKKFGENIGLEIWENRQTKWKESLKNSDYDGSFGKDARSINTLKEKYGDYWVEKYISLNFNSKKKEDIRYLLSFSDYKEMILSLINSNIKLGKIYYMMKYPIICEFYETKLENIHSFLLENYEENHGTPKYYEKIYGSEWIDKYITSKTFKNKEEIYFLLSFNNYKEMIDHLLDKYPITEIIPKIKGSLISYYYKMEYKDIFNYITDKDPYIKSKFGHMRYYNGHLCRSNGEYFLSKFLTENKIDYEYEKKYKDTNMRCDFYLIKKDFYIEYTGMNTKTSINNYKKKENITKLKNFNVLFSNNINNIKNKIIELYEIKNEFN